MYKHIGETSIFIMSYVLVTSKNHLFVLKLVMNILKWYYTPEWKMKVTLQNPHQSHFFIRKVHHFQGLTYAYVSEKAMAPHSSTLAWKIPWMEEPGGLQSMGSLRVGHDWATSLSLFTLMHWRRKWQPTLVFLPWESQGQGSLVGCRLWGRTEATKQQQPQHVYIYTYESYTLLYTWNQHNIARFI